MMGSRPPTLTGHALGASNAKRAAQRPSGLRLADYNYNTLALDLLATDLCALQLVACCSLFVAACCRLAGSQQPGSAASASSFVPGYTSRAARAAISI